MPNFPLNNTDVKTEFVLAVDANTSEDFIGVDSFIPASDLCAEDADIDGNIVKVETNEEMLENLLNVEMLPQIFYGMRENLDKLVTEDEDGNQVGNLGNSMFRQFIGYVVVSSDDKLTGDSEVFLYSRKKEATEGRLVGCCSIGIGGHVSIADTVLDHESGCIDAHATIFTSMVREVTEELKIPQGYDVPNCMTFLGFSQDFESEVNELHVALVYHLKIDPRMLRTDEIGLNTLEPATLKSFTELSREESPLEPWSYSIAEYYTEESEV